MSGNSSTLAFKKTLVIVISFYAGMKSFHNLFLIHASLVNLYPSCHIPRYSISLTIISNLLSKNFPLSKKNDQFSLSKYDGDRSSLLN